MAKAKVRKMKGEDYPRFKGEFIRCCGPGIGFPLLLVLIGIWLIGRDLGWWHQAINIWGVILVTIGVYWLLKAVLYK